MHHWGTQNKAGNAPSHHRKGGTTKPPLHTWRGKPQIHWMLLTKKSHRTIQPDSQVSLAETEPISAVGGKFLYRTEAHRDSLNGHCFVCVGGGQRRDKEPVTNCPPPHPRVLLLKFRNHAKPGLSHGFTQCPLAPETYAKEQVILHLLMIHNKHEPTDCCLF